ncbi:DUF2510 domain-containing protein [Iamia sp. SCSIO 61187]|uniref:DUF2510 domain-containing protein n=1 Tax=Iamia sp. SCSIO 61187 TaxID=2722752 RepID=UPI001C63834F|nr:DUF2510 domain-containing protein [Iamia sp. SCSIO 61187]QYG93751.1 DUF2510 domain-containing protein [Iamia sp. SCSIO 61187]
MTDAGWHPDPTGRPGQRYHDGSRWTEHVTDAAGAQSVDHDGAQSLAAGPGSSPGGGGDGEIQIGPPPARSSTAPAADHEPAQWPGDHEAGPAPAPPAGQPSWGGPAAAGSWSPSPPPGSDGGAWGGAPPAPKRKRVDKVSIIGLLLAVLGIGVGVAALFALPWLDIGGNELDFADARRDVDDSGVFGAVASGLMINIAYFIVAVGGVVALAKALGSRAMGTIGLVLAVVGLVALIAVGVAAIPVEQADPTFIGGDAATMLESEAEDRLTGTAVFTGVVMFVSTVLAGVGLLLHGIGGRILAFLGLGLLVLFALGGIVVLRNNVEDLLGGFASVDLALGAWAIVASAVLLALGAAVPGGRREV